MMMTFIDCQRTEEDLMSCRHNKQTQCSCSQLEQLGCGTKCISKRTKRSTTIAKMLLKGWCNTICPWMWSIVGAGSTRPNCSSLMHLCPAVLFCSSALDWRLAATVPISAPTRDCRKKRAARLPECHKLLSTNLWNHLEELRNKHFTLLQLFVLKQG